MSLNISKIHKAVTTIKNGKSIEVLKFYDESGNIQKNIRNITDTKTGGLKTIKTTFNAVDGVADKSLIRDVFVNGKLQTTTTEKFSGDKFNGFVHSKLEIHPLIKGRYEKQTIETLFPNAKHLFIKTEHYRASNGKVKMFRVESNVESAEKLMHHKNYRYLPVHMYEKKDLALSCAHISNEIKELGTVPELKIKKLSCLGEYTPFGIFIDAQKHNNKSELVDTVNHELHHATQLSIFDTIKKILTEKHSSTTQKYILNEGFSCFANIPAVCMQASGCLLQKMKLSKIGRNLEQKGYNIYYNELIEKQARLAGKKAKNDYGKTCSSLANLFREVSPSHFAEEEYGLTNSRLLFEKLSKSLKSKNIKVEKPVILNLSAASR